MIIENFDRNSPRPPKTALFRPTLDKISEFKEDYKLGTSMPEEVRRLMTEGLIAQRVTITGGNFSHLSESEAAQTGGMWGMYSAVNQPKMSEYRFGEKGKLYLLFPDSPEIKVGRIDRDPTHPTFDTDYFNRMLQGYIETDPEMSAMREKLSGFLSNPSYFDFLTSKIKRSAEKPQLFQPQVQIINYGELVTTSLTFISVREKTLFEQSFEKGSQYGR